MFAIHGFGLAVVSDVVELFCDALRGVRNISARLKFKLFISGSLGLRVGLTFLALGIVLSLRAQFELRAQLFFCLNVPIVEILGQALLFAASHSSTALILGVGVVDRGRIKAIALVLVVIVQLDNLEWQSFCKRDVLRVFIVSLHSHVFE